MESLADLKRRQDDILRDVIARLEKVVRADYANLSDSEIYHLLFGFVLARKGPTGVDGAELASLIDAWLDLDALVLSHQSGQPVTHGMGRSAGRGQD